MTISVLPYLLVCMCLFMLTWGTSVLAEAPSAYPIGDISDYPSSYPIDYPSAYPIGELSDYPSAGPVPYDDGHSSTFPSAYPAIVNATILEIIGSEIDLTTASTLIAASRLGFAKPPYTVFAPANDAFYQLSQEYPFISNYLQPEYILHLQQLLRLHVTVPAWFESNLTNGLELAMGSRDTVYVATTQGGVTLKFATSNTTIVEPDSVATDGVVYKVNTVLVPPFFLSNLNDVVSYYFQIEQYGIFKNLLALAPTITNLLSTGTTYTLLVPTNAAFLNLPNGTIEFLSAPENVNGLTDILSYHIVTKILPSPLIVDETLSTVEGSTITTSVDPNGILFNNARVVDLNILANNGVIHGIDTVLTPFSNQK